VLSIQPNFNEEDGIMKKSFKQNARAGGELMFAAALILQLAVVGAMAQNAAPKYTPYDEPVKPMSPVKRVPAESSTVTAPANDSFANAAQFGGGSGGMAMTNAQATSEPGEPAHGAGRGGSSGANNSVWFKHVAIADGVLTVYTASNDNTTLDDTVISIYTGSAVNALTPVAECDDFPGLQFHCRLTLAVTAGQTHYIAVDGYGGNTGSFWFSYYNQTFPYNDNFANAQHLGASPMNPLLGITGSNFGAASETGEPTHAPSGGSNNSIWYTWTPVSSQSITFKTLGSNFDTVLAVYTGSSVNALTLVGKNDDFGPPQTYSSQVTFYATAGVTYRIAVDGFSSVTGNLFLTWNRYQDESLGRFSFDGDGRGDISIFRPSNGQWWINNSSTNSTVAATFGTPGDQPVPADYTGDGKVDVAFWRPSTGTWYILRSEDSSFYSIPFGTNGDIPVSGRFDNDMAADIAIFRPSNATWYIRQSRNSQALIQQFGLTGDIPVPADYDGDGRADMAIYRPSNGQWWLNRSSAGVIAATFGTATDKPTIGDYTGDGRTDIAFWRPSSGEWFILRSEDSSYYSFPFGISTDIPAPADYNGDGRFDQAVFRGSEGTWYIKQSGGLGEVLIKQFGIAGDRPTENSYIP
jgi:hypothetical protein